MPLIVYLKKGQGLKIGNVWVYAGLVQKGSGISIAIVADENTEIMREEIIMREGGDTGPLFNPDVYRKDQTS